MEFDLNIAIWDGSMESDLNIAIWDGSMEFDLKYCLLELFHGV